MGQLPYSYGNIGVSYEMGRLSGRDRMDLDYSPAVDERVKLLANRLVSGTLIFAVALVGTLLLAACGNGDTESVPQAPIVRSSGDSDGSAPDSRSFPQAIPPDSPLEAPSEVPEELRVVWEVWALLTREHVDRSEMDPEVFMEAAIQGLLKALGDPHTHYIRPEAFNIENEDLDGKFEGIGANVSMRRDGKLIIVSPLDGSPAEAAGLRPGDIILEVDGESLEGLSLLEAVAKIRGPRGSEVRLLIKHLGALDPVEIVVRRDEIPLVSVLLRSKPGDRIAHIRLTTFYADSAELLGEMIQEAVDDGAEGLILDVRDNPGGLLRAAIEVTSQFLKEGLVLYEVDGAGQRTDWNVRSGGVATEIPLVLLTNGGSASASEILVGALQDHQRATVVGATTFGKGTVGILRELSNKAGLSIIIARFFTPSGRQIEDNGLEPDVEVVNAADPQKAEVLQLERAREVLEDKIQANRSTSVSR